MIEPPSSFQAMQYWIWQVRKYNSGKNAAPAAIFKPTAATSAASRGQNTSLLYDARSEKLDFTGLFVAYPINEEE